MSLENESERPIEVANSNSEDFQDEATSASTPPADSITTAPVDSNSAPAATVTAASKQCQLPFARIKTIMKLDSDLGLSSKEGVFMVAKATVLIKILISQFIRVVLFGLLEEKK